MMRCLSVDVNHSRCVETPTWPDVEDVINRTISSVESSSKFIAQLKTWIITRTTGGDEKGKLVQTFQDIINGKPTSIPATLHCEMVMAMLGYKVLCLRYHRVMLWKRVDQSWV